MDTKCARISFACGIAGQSEISRKKCNMACKGKGWGVGAVNIRHEPWGRGVVGNYK